MRFARLMSCALLPILIATALCGCGGSITRKVEKGIAQSLPGLIGPAKSYKVKVYGSTVDMLRSRMDGIDISGEGVELKNGLAIARLEVSLKGVRFNADSRQITKCDDTQFSASLAQEELRRYLKKTYPDIPGLEVRLRDGVLWASASPSLIGLTASIEAESALKIRSHSQLVLDLRKVTVAGLPAPGFAREYIEKRLNPVFDASALGYDATVDSVSIRGGYLTISGKLDLLAK